MRFRTDTLVWTRFRPIGNSLPKRLTVLIPIIGYLIIFNSTLAHYAELISVLNGNSHVVGVELPDKVMSTLSTPNTEAGVLNQLEYCAF